jgi:phosphohistidine phosphatase
LIRHATAVSAGQYRDFDRPLKKKGREKIKQNTEILSGKGYYPNLLLSSSALRALQTAEIFAETIEPEFPLDAILFLEQLYLPSVEEMMMVVQQLDSSATDVFLVSHNNGISFFAQTLCGNRGIIMPAGAVVRIKFESADWTEISPGSGEMTDFIP